jgi:hypothetical protein
MFHAIALRLCRPGDNIALPACGKPPASGQSAT